MISDNQSELIAALDRTDPISTTATLEITFWRVDDNDTTGSFDIECSGVQNWVYSNIGSHHGAQVDEGISEQRVLEFGGKLRDLVSDFFKDIPPTIFKSKILV